MLIEDIDKRLKIKKIRRNKGEQRIMRKSTTNKGVNIDVKRVQEIENYNLSLGSMTNINTRSELKFNPIGLKVAVRTLKELMAELEGYHIDIKEIDCNRVYSNDMELTETEVFIRTICNYTYLNYRNDYLKMIEQRELEKVFPIEERKSRILELEEEIRREILKSTTIGKLNKELRKSCEARAEELRKELHSIEETFNVADEEYLNSILYTLAEYKLREITERLEKNIIYLENVMEEI